MKSSARCTNQYQISCFTIPGAKEFLQELYDAGIPMAAASSTPCEKFVQLWQLKVSEHLLKQWPQQKMRGGTRLSLMLILRLFVVLALIVKFTLGF